MPDHFHLIVNPRDGRIREFMLNLKGLSAKRIVDSNTRFRFEESEEDGFQVWQESFKAQPLWSSWMMAKDKLHSCQPCEGGVGEVGS